MFHRIYKQTLCIVGILMLSACATQISQDKLATADFGAEPPSNYQDIIKERIDRTLIDPTSGIYRFTSKPRKGYFKTSPIVATREQFGYLVCGHVNGKNRFGGYTGGHRFAALMRGEHVVQLLSGNTGDSLANVAISKWCIENVVTN